LLTWVSFSPGDFAITVIAQAAPILERTITIQNPLNASRLLELKDTMFDGPPLSVATISPGPFDAKHDLIIGAGHNQPVLIGYLHRNESQVFSVSFNYFSIG
jgi:hypothetical protein